MQTIAITSGWLSARSVQLPGLIDQSAAILQHFVAIASTSVLGADGVAAVLAAYRSGEPAKSIAQRVGISRQSVNILAAEAGLPRRLGRLTNDQQEEIVDLYLSGLGQGAVATRLGLGKSTVQAVLQRRHIKRRNGSAQAVEHA